MHPFLEAWAKWRPSESAPFVMGADRESLLAGERPSKCVIHSSWSAAIGDERFGARDDKRLHLGLCPHPFCGDLSRADIFILMLNPGLSATDYFGEYEVEGFRHAVLRNLRQQVHDENHPFMFLNPKFSWHKGFGWWNDKLAAVIQTLAVEKSLADKRHWSFSEARQHLARRLASIELFPYHSASFDSGRWIKGKNALPSVELAMQFVKDLYERRVKNGKAIIIATRKVSAWQLPVKAKGVIRYTGGEARGAHLTPGSPGGIAILERLLSNLKTRTPMKSAKNLRTAP
ncbi:MAG TPA: hypothetical protein VG056_13780 [Pirellulales bacterium]|nr:hypothetical protein [Pirellulales bacterium]